MCKHSITAIRYRRTPSISSVFFLHYWFFPTAIANYTPSSFSIVASPDLPSISIHHRPPWVCPASSSMYIRPVQYPPLLSPLFTNVANILRYSSSPPSHSSAIFSTFTGYLPQSIVTISFPNSPIALIASQCTTVRHHHPPSPDPPSHIRLIILASLQSFRSSLHICTIHYLLSSKSDRITISV